jgi:Zn-dependent protease
MAERSLTTWCAPVAPFGIRIRVHLSWLLMALLIGWSLGSTALPTLYPGLSTGAYWGVAGLILAGLAVSILLHEFAHALTGRAFGLSVERVTLFLLGGLSELKEEPTRPGPELAMALAGPAFSVLFSVVLAMASGFATVSGQPPVIAFALAYLATLNFVIALFNLAPAFPLDGGRVLRAILWMITKDRRWATAMAVRTSEILALLLIGAGLATVFANGLAEGLWWILIGLFVRMAARGALLELDAQETYAGHRIDQVMVRAVETLPAHLTLDEFVRGRLLSARHSLYPVVAGDAWLGVLDPAEILRTPRERWAQTTVGQICTPAALAPSARVDDDAGAVLDRMQHYDTAGMVVADRGGVVGLVTLRDLIQGVRRRRRFGFVGA